MKQAVRRAMKAGAQGIMITVSGRLSGADMARRESQREGQVPRHTLRADIDYANVEGLTTFSKIGIKVWVYKGEILPKPKEETPMGAYVSP
jgi:small subunit ribosomal protein S3